MSEELRKEGELIRRRKTTSFNSIRGKGKDSDRNRPRKRKQNKQLMCYREIDEKRNRKNRTQEERENREESTVYVHS